MKSTLRKAFFVVLRASGLPFILRHTVQRGRVTILMYHDPSKTNAAAQLSALARRYNIISLEDCVAALRGGFEQLPPRALVVTFDDGFARNRELLDLFQRHDIKPSIFVCAGLVGTRRRLWFTTPMTADAKQRLKDLPDAQRLAELAALGYDDANETADIQALSNADIAALRDVVDFGSHTMSHPVLPNCVDDKAWREISESKQQLEAAYGLNVWAFAYPNGDATPRDEAFVKRAGYGCAVTTNTGMVTPDTDPFRLPRLDINDDGSVSEAIVQASGLWAGLRPALKGMLGFLKRS